MWLKIFLQFHVAVQLQFTKQSFYPMTTVPFYDKAIGEQSDRNFYFDLANRASLIIEAIFRSFSRCKTCYFLIMQSHWEEVEIHKNEL